jgi:hypothetical protein
MTRLLITYDGSRAARTAVAATAALFGAAEAVVATVYPPPPDLGSSALAPIELLDAMVHEGLERHDVAAATAAEGAELGRVSGLNASPQALAGARPL